MPKTTRQPSPAGIKPSPNKKKKAKVPKPAPIPPPALATWMEPEQVALATTTFNILKKQKQVILVGKEDVPGCTKTIAAGEATRMYTERLVRARPDTKRGALLSLPIPTRDAAAHHVFVAARLARATPSSPSMSARIPRWPSSIGPT